MPDTHSNHGEHLPEKPRSPGREEQREKEGVGQWVQRQFLKHALPWMPGGMMAFPDMVEGEERDKNNSVQQIEREQTEGVNNLKARIAAAVAQHRDLAGPLRHKPPTPRRQARYLDTVPTRHDSHIRDTRHKGRESRVYFFPDNTAIRRRTVNYNSAYGSERFDVLERRDNLAEVKRKVIHDYFNAFNTLRPTLAGSKNSLRLVDIRHAYVDGDRAMSMMERVLGQITNAGDLSDYDIYEELRSYGILFDAHPQNFLKNGDEYTVLEVNDILHPEALKKVQTLKSEDRKKMIRYIAKAHVLGATASYPIIDYYHFSNLRGDSKVRWEAIASLEPYVGTTPTRAQLAAANVLFSDDMLGMRQDLTHWDWGQITRTIKSARQSFKRKDGTPWKIEPFDWEEGSNIDNYGITRATFADFRSAVLEARKELAPTMEYANQELLKSGLRTADTARQNILSDLKTQRNILPENTATLTVGQLQRMKTMLQSRLASTLDWFQQHGGYIDRVDPKGHMRGTMAAALLGRPLVRDDKDPARDQLIALLKAHDARSIRKKREILSEAGYNEFEIRLALMAKMCGKDLSFMHFPDITDIRPLVKGFSSHQANLIHAFIALEGKEVDLSRAPELPKSTRMFLLSRIFPNNRPLCDVCSYDTVEETIEAMGREFVYVKGESSDSRDVCRIQVKKETYVVQFASSDMAFEIPKHLLGERLFSARSSHVRSETLIVEEAIAEALTEDGLVWEMRFLPCGKGSDVTERCSYLKTGKPGLITASVHMGGQQHLGADRYKVLESVIKKCSGRTDIEWITKKRKSFLDEAAKLADATRFVVDEHYRNTARRIFKPEDMREPHRYEEMITTCFSSVVQCVDIKGVWEREEQRLRPVIVETQEMAGTPEEIMREVHAVVAGRGVPDLHDRLVNEYLTPDAVKRIQYSDRMPKQPLLENLYSKYPDAARRDRFEQLDGFEAAENLVVKEAQKNKDERDYEAVLKTIRSTLRNTKDDQDRHSFIETEIEYLVTAGMFGNEIVRVAAEERTALEGLVQEDMKAAVERLRVDPKVIYQLGNVEVLGKIAVELGVKVSDATNIGKMQEEIMVKLKK